MAQERSEAIVLRGIDFSESSRIVTFLTPDRGKLACMAAGARRAKSPIAGALDTYNRVEIVYYWRESRSVQKLAEAALIDGYSALKKDLAKSAYAAVPLEVVYKVAHENEPSEMMYETLTTGLASLAAWQGDARTHAAWQIMGVLRAAGFAPATAPGDRSFSYDTGLVSSGGDVRFSEKEAKDLCNLMGLTPPDAPVNNRIFRAIVRYTEHHLESSMRSARVAEEMAG